MQQIGKIYSSVTLAIGHSGETLKIHVFFETTGNFFLDNLLQIFIGCRWEEFIFG
jgi:hypothetical protein